MMLNYKQCFRERPCRNDSLKDNRPIVSYKLHAEDLRHKLRRKGLQQQPVSRSYLPWKLIPGSGTTHQRSVKFEKLASALHQQPIESEKLAGYKHQLAASSNLLKYKAVAEPPLNPVPASLNKISQKETELSVDRGLEKYSMTFKVEEVDMPSLKHMTDDDLKTIGLPMDFLFRIDD
ncbi:uncharacterized protein LOC121999803 [Zingiber officinale]|uniref:uncharacterized protein LOC121999803 n=1 Tax=Zingiber officinale TaxID=94328 RepID=UPI001C4B352C|nr:uncharacterized protein LOC121999803 [Zingiber officinale]